MTSRGYSPSTEQISFARTMAQIILYVACVGFLSCSQNGEGGIVINSCVLRNRVIVLDRVVLKKALYVAFTFPDSIQEVKVRGSLLCNGERLAEAELDHFRERNGNLVFDLPAEIPEGKYTVRLEAFREEGEIFAWGALAVNRQDLRSTIGGKDKPAVSDAVFPRAQRVESAAPTDGERSIGYIIFNTSLLEPYDASRIPARSEVIDKLKVRVVRNEYEPVTFSLYPLRELGRVRVTMSRLKGEDGTLPLGSISIGYVGLPQGYPVENPSKASTYPRVILSGDSVIEDAGSDLRFWITLHIGADQIPGEYRGIVTITPEHGRERRIPLQIIVEPVTLENIPGKDFFMLMTYEFTELTMPWTALEKKKIYEAACNILKDYRAHGMTTVCIHSPFVFMAREDGSPDLEDIYATLRAARDVGFTRPVIWYVGHLIQTAKPRHPGNITAFDAAVDLPRLKTLVEDVTAYAKKHACPEVIILPIDEPDDLSQDPHGRRHDVTPKLLQAIKDSGARTMITSRTADGFGPVDFLDSGELNEKELASAHRNGRTYWLYNNDVTTRCGNPAYARYVYGYYTWMTGVDGMSSWTFQNTQNANGQPNDVFLAYPNPAGPLPTLKWEAIREGIDDQKLIYQLEKRVLKLKRSGLDTTAYDNYLASLKSKKGIPACNGEGEDTWSSSIFQTYREGLITMIVDADRRIARHKSITPATY